MVPRFLAGPAQLTAQLTAAAVLLATAALVPAAAAPVSQPTAAAASTTAPTLPVQVDSAKTITLLTGDKVHLTPAGSGRSNVRFVPVDPAAAGYETRTVGKDLYVVPDSAARLVQRGKVDEALFNVSALIRQGFDDASTDRIPVITTYKATARSAQQPVPNGATRTRSLPSVGAAALRTEKTQAHDTWSALTTPTDPAGRELDKIWLDAKVKSTLDQSVPYVGAPQAWQAGFDGTGTTVAVLDTGVDAEHPDLAGAVKAEMNFTDSPDADDHDGHGTHTSSTVAGRGVASNGRNKGVAPGAQLLSGKVLNDFGNGDLSWIIAGMEWAVAEGADVVSMSIGTSEPVDCTDPMAQAVDRISAASGVLFVVAAGNLGGPTETITSPGCAPSALTVAATDLTGATAYFSGRGPVMTAHTVKPDIAAPGVDITAARAGGRGDSAYTDMNGTSMATPHVAGAAAILKQQHPDWTGAQVKAALQNTVRSATSAGIYEQGAGELDLANAVTQQVTGPGTTDVGTFGWPHTPAEKVTKQLAYTNTGSKAVTLRFSTDARGNNGKTLPRSLLKLGSTSLTVPAGQSASLPLTIDPSVKLDYGLYGAIGARVVATGNDGRTVVTPIGFYLEPQHVDVTVKLIDRNGKPASSITFLDVFDLDSIAAQRIGFEGADQTLHLRAGTYSLAASVATDGADGLVESYAFLGDPEITLTKNTTITYDARRAAQTKVTTDRPAERRGGSLSYGRVIDGWVLASSRSFGSTVKAIYLADTLTRARRGTFEVVEGWQLGSPAAAPSPYLYSLAFTHSRRIDGDTNHRVRDRQLATIDATYYTPGKAYTYSEYVDAWRPWSLSLIPVGPRGSVAAPNRVEHLVTAERDTKMSQMVGHSDAMAWPFATLMTSTAKAYRAGSHHRETWYKAGLRPGMVRDQTTGAAVVPAAREGNAIWSNFPAWANTETGHFAWQGFLDLGNTELFADGVSLGQYGYYGQGWWDVPAESASFELVYNLLRWQRGNYSWESPANAETRWRFTSSSTASGALPLLFPDYDLEVDAGDRAPRVKDYPVSVTVSSGEWYKPGSLTTARAWVSYDDGATWVDVPVKNYGTKVVASVDNTAATDFVTLKVELTDANGVGVTQTLNRLYGIR